MEEEVLNKGLELRSGRNICSRACQDVEGNVNAAKERPGMGLYW
jgi:hypothetical protein